MPGADSRSTCRPAHQGGDERAAWRAERASYQQAVLELEQDLEGHRATLATVSADLDEHRRSIAAFERRVEELRAKTVGGLVRRVLAKLGIRPKD